MLFLKKRFVEIAFSILAINTLIVPSEGVGQYLVLVALVCAFIVDKINSKTKRDDKAIILDRIKKNKEEIAKQIEESKVELLQQFNSHVSDYEKEIEYLRNMVQKGQLEKVGKLDKLNEEKQKFQTNLQPDPKKRFY